MTRRYINRASVCWLGGLLCGAAVAAGAFQPAVAGGAETRRIGKDTMAEKFIVYVGTYTGPKSRGIYTYRFDTATGALTPVGLGAETPNPSFLAIHPNRRFLYAVNEIGNYEGQKAGSVTGFAIDPETAGLTELRSQSSIGPGPCHLVVDHAGKNVLVANYGGGSFAVLPIGADGQLGKATSFIQHQGSSVNKQRQEAPHGHSINVDPANRHAFAADLGLDKVFIYRFDADKGTLTPNEPPSASVPPGSGPRHFAFHPGGRHAYVINEMTSTVTAFDYDPQSGKLTPVQTLSTLPEGFSGNTSTAEVQVHPSGKFLYGSNRGHDSIAIFTIDPKTGRLTAAGHQPTGGKTPRNFGIDPTGKFLLAANQGTDTITVFRIDQESGKLTQVGEPVAAPSPVCVKFMPAP